MLKIRHINAAAHADEIYEFQEAHFKGVPVIAATSADWWFAYDHDEPVAFAGLSPSYRWRDCGYLCRVGVAPEYRGSGLQKRLIRARIAKARQKGWVYLYSDTTDIPESANSLISCGFKTYRPTRPYCFKNTIYWRLRL